MSNVFAANAASVKELEKQRLVSKYGLITGDQVRNDPWYRNKYLTVVADDPCFFPGGLEKELERRNSGKD